jgi:SpoVK/Ycf46/Vps4 family AAA+-type ATPase
VDALLGRRKDGDHEATTNLKTEFMQHWDGLLPADATHHILVLGATNRPAELDAAVMRRFSLQLEVRRRRRRRRRGPPLQTQCSVVWRSEACGSIQVPQACRRHEP